MIVSGDLTTKNEENGLSECLKHLSELNINQDNIYIVPGNHDCDRDGTNEKIQFSKFISYFSEYNSPFVKNKYILNKELKLFIIGFNSVHISPEDDKQELFYIKEEKIDELIKLVDKLSNEIDDFDRYTKLAVVHNNIVPHPSVEVKKYADILNVYKFKYTLNQLGFKFIFSGHKHQSLIERHITYGDDSQGDLLLISAASLCGQVVGERNGFQSIDIYKDLASDRLNKIIVKEYYSNQIGLYKEEKQYEIKY
ncbi:metallophosphoesterase [Clostridium sp. DL-VIII]|uniref:metallophosphoesterase family protein n=1 Tax=Clostridium sp. DL-VIII TaxID=641107 RepID=UPI00023AF978|nr:metallophosphoesterase [Clostridium sp. DL-VIII]EHJ00582.1 metallophosphoesterase [Clostridium sp. DL-VIII]